MISFNGQYPLKQLLWVWGALILFFLIRFTNWKAAIWRQSGGNIFPTSGKKIPTCGNATLKHKTPVIIIISDNYKGFSILIVSEPDGTQTHDLQNRYLALYSTKLRVHTIILHACSEQSSMIDKRYV